MRVRHEQNAQPRLRITDAINIAERHVAAGGIRDRRDRVERGLDPADSVRAGDDQRVGGQIDCSIAHSQFAHRAAGRENHVAMGSDRLLQIELQIRFSRRLRVSVGVAVEDVCRQPVDQRCSRGRLIQARVCLVGQISRIAGQDTGGSQSTAQVSQPNLASIRVCGREDSGAQEADVDVATGGQRDVVVVGVGQTDCLRHQQIAERVDRQAAVGDGHVQFERLSAGILNGDVAGSMSRQCHTSHSGVESAAETRRVERQLPAADRRVRCLSELAGDLERDSSAVRDRTDGRIAEFRKRDRADQRGQRADERDVANVE